MIRDWRTFLSVDPEEELLSRIRRHTRTGRPLGSEAFLDQLEARTGLTFLPQKRGLKQKGNGKEGSDE